MVRLLHIVLPWLHHYKFGGIKLNYTGRLHQVVLYCNCGIEIIHYGQDS